MVLPLLLSLLAFSFTSLAQAGENSPPELRVMVYDSFQAPEGLGSAIFPIFEKKCRCRVKVLTAGDGGAMLGRLQLDAARSALASGPHVVVGIDQILWDQARALAEPWGDWAPSVRRLEKRWSLSLRGQTEVLVKEGWLPWNYGIQALMVNREWARKNPELVPRRLSDLTRPELKKKWILEDPRTSTPGLGFVAFTEAVFKQKFGGFWSAARSQWLTLAPGWDQAYGLFLNQEAPLVWSYTTSEAYHRRVKTEPDFFSVVFEEGNPLQVEGAFLVKGSLQSQAERQLARSFLEFLLSDEVQSRIPETNWMYPVVRETKLPETFSRLPHPSRELLVTLKAAELQALLRRWSEAVSGSFKGSFR